MMQKQETENPIEDLKAAAQSAAHAETAPPRVRRYRMYIFQAWLFSVLIAFIVLALLVRTSAYFPIDLLITRHLQEISSPLFANVMSMISWAGYLPQSVGITAFIIAFLYFFGLHWESLMGFVVAIFDEAMNTLIKIVVHRPRPSIDLVHVVVTLNGFSFPSGHVMFYTGFFGFIWFLAFTLLRNSWMRTLILTLFGSLILLIGVSRIYLGEHWTSDVVGAYLLGTLVLVAGIQAYRWGKPRFFIHQPVANK